MFELSVKSRFSAAHHLKDYAGACAALHGHNWEVEVYLQGEELDASGILVDFRAIKAAVGQVLEKLDHSDLNALDCFQGRNPTSEIIARFIFRELSRRLDRDDCRVHRVSVNETPEARATYWEP